MRDDNYGVQDDWQPGSPPQPAMPREVSSADERSWSVLAHLSTFLNLFTGFLGPVAALAIWLAYKDRSAYVADNAMRSAVYQGVWLVGLFLGWSLTLFLMAFIVGFLLVPVMAVLSVAFFVHAGYEAYQAYRGRGSLPLS